ncbi:glycerol-3-phosphate 1-O-acyltransferase PlsY [Blochmannia endosymbiont of Colobopsis nipponica]|uniref:glycerol-3-phosphate 1-O-acyltransferase PlsY n=1 Tax=Blochmannia endosymbiont of Colobopsis nipponica TaxID=2681987 RepID=UPI00178087ED|nr:glycerol-3-phosphate 1-O-acyltransferase PlsY [Blochmannia endosymbiont of Colobopsis nipponica]QOI10790.1 glycerol-3-phosphate 1-O-acyltransferase PlsY [Blochmannia endosymbiont of Colobopsis nipponica]
MSIIILITIFAYFCGSISSAILICKFNKLPDPRSIGSKNPGTTNVLRINKKIAIYVLLCDILKGMIPMWISYLFNIPNFWLGIIPIVTCIGHIYPIFFKFYGGKGVATTFGSLTTIGWDLSSIMITTWIMTVLLTRFSSLGAIITSIIIPIYAWYYKSELAIQITALSVIILFKHKNNMYRLLKGQENRI